MSSKDDEKVLVIPASELWDVIGPQKGIFQSSATARVLIESEKCEFRRRGDVETDPSWKQLIPYAILKKGGRIFTYTRPNSGGEDRLHDKRSIGIGGHICEDDQQFNVVGPYVTGLFRELAEEVGLASADIVPTPRGDGVIYDPSDDVGMVHVGIIHIIEVPRGREVWPREDELTDAEWLTVAELRDQYSRLETWSQLFLNAYHPA